jgi:MFS family permease
VGVVQHLEYNAGERCSAIDQIKSNIISITGMQDVPQPFRSQKIRFFVLFLVSMVVFGNQYAFNNPQALEQYMEKDLDIGATQFQLLYTIFAFPNIFATFFIGFLIDYLGVRIGLITLTVGITVFQLSIAIGGYAESYTTILIGRMLFGLASESLITAQASMVSFWFKGK